MKRALTDDQIRIIRIENELALFGADLYRKYSTHSQAIKYNVASRAIQRIVNYETYKEISPVLSPMEMDLFIENLEFPEGIDFLLNAKKHYEDNV